jgi:arginine/serine-rich splicing factor 15
MLTYLFQKLLDRFDYDDEPEAVEESKKEDAAALTPAVPAAAAPAAPAVAAAAAAAPAAPAPVATSPPPQAPL